MSETTLPSAGRTISRLRYLILFISINVIGGFIIFLAAEAQSAILTILATLLLHYLVVVINCCRLRDSGFSHIKAYVWITIGIYILSFVLIVAEEFDCDGFGMPLLLIWYFSTFSLLLLAPTNIHSSVK